MLRIDARTAGMLRRWFPSLQMDNIRIVRDGPVCWFVRSVLRQGAMTISPFVFFGRHRYDPTTVASVALLAHELKHVEQYRRYGHVFFLWRYFFDMSRRGFRYSRLLPLEAEAYALQAEVREALQAQSG